MKLQRRLLLFLMQHFRLLLLHHLPKMMLVAKDILAPAENRTRGPTMATLDFTTKPLVLLDNEGNF